MRIKKNKIILLVLLGMICIFSFLFYNQITPFKKIISTQWSAEVYSEISLESEYKTLRIKDKEEVDSIIEILDSLKLRKISQSTGNIIYKMTIYGGVKDEKNNTIFNKYLDIRFYKDNIISIMTDEGKVLKCRILNEDFTFDSILYP